MASTIIALVGGATAWVVGLFNTQQPLMNIRDLNTTLAPLLSPGATIWLSGTEGFELATERWSPRIHPQFDLAVNVATEEDVSHTVWHSSFRYVTLE
jgi:hypothetical protein